MAVYVVVPAVPVDGDTDTVPELGASWAAPTFLML